ncbi:MAG: autotransporter-associated beta strand repeat-containing protein, partial [Verrucomicrobiales bacterium]|nr:autotransporter-associated beta strand repeat-containing protein [Verrucomicrobiales bacterium]
MKQLKPINIRIWGKWTAVVLLTANLALAQTWTGDGADGDWSNTANWDGGSLPVLPATLTFDGNQQLNTNNDWAASATVSGLTFALTAGDFTLSGNALTLATSSTVAVLGAASQTIGLNFNLLNYGVEFNVAAGGTLTVSGNISGGTDNSPYNNALNSRALTVSGDGDVLLSGSNSYHGSVNVNGGRLLLGGDHVLGAFSTNNQNAGNGYSLVLNSGTVEMNGHHAMLYGYTGSVGTLMVNSAGGDAVTLTFAGGNSLYGLANTNFSGNLRLVFSATFLGTSVMSIANDYTGGTVFQDNAGADVALISVSGSYAAPSNALRVINALALGSGTVEFAGNGYMGSNNSGASGWDNWLNDIQVTGTNNWLAFFNNTNSKGSWHGDGTINIHNGFWPTFTFSGNMSDFTGRLNLISGGNDIFAITGAAADSLVNAGITLVLADNTGTSNRYVYLQATDANPTVQIGDLSTLSAPGGGAELGAYGAAVVRHTAAGFATFQVGALGLSSTFAGIVSDNGAITVVDGTLTFADSHGNNKSALTKVGVGTWTLTNQNTYTGTT